MLYQKLDGNLITTTLDEVLNWARENSLWYLPLGLACCGIEMMQTGGPRADLERFGMAPRFTPRQPDVLIIAGTMTYKMAIRAKLLYEQMAEPRYVISMGSCSNCGGLFQKSYSVIKGADQIIPVDIYVPGCPPRPEALVEGIFALRKKIQKEGYLRKPAVSGSEQWETSRDFSVFAYPEGKPKSAHIDEQSTSSTDS